MRQELTAYTETFNQQVTGLYKQQLKHASENGLTIMSEIYVSTLLLLFTYYVIFSKKLYSLVVDQ